MSSLDIEIGLEEIEAALKKEKVIGFELYHEF